MYCSVCKEKYEDYRDVKYLITQHILNDKHKKRIKVHKFNSYILEMEAKYRLTRK